jgi:hypothetical protein
VGGLATDTSIDNHAVGTHTSPHIVHGEQHPVWSPRGGAPKSMHCLAVSSWRRVPGWPGLVLTLGSLFRRRRSRRVSNLAGAHDWSGLGLGHPVAWRGESCVAHRHDGSGPLDHDRADRRTNGDDPLSRCDGTSLSGLLDHSLLWALQTSRPAQRSLINRCNRQPSISAASMTPPQTQIRPTTPRSDRRRYRI